MSSLLLSERPLVVLPSLVKRVGLTRAVILQQIHWLLEQPHNGKVIGGVKWIWGDYDKWRELYFPFWSRRTLQRHILRLEEEGYLISAQHNALNWDRTKYYRLDYDRLNSALPSRAAAALSESPTNCGRRCGDAVADADLPDASAQDGEDPTCGPLGGGAADPGARDGVPASAASRPMPAAREAPSRRVTIPDRSGCVIVLDKPEDFDSASMGPQDTALCVIGGRLQMRTASESDWLDVPTDDPLSEAYIDWLAGAYEFAGGDPACAEQQTAGAGGSCPAPLMAGSASTDSGVQMNASQESPARGRRDRSDTAPRTAAPQRARQHASSPSRGSSHDRCDSPTLPPSISAFYELHGRLPNHAQKRMIIDAGITDQILWRRCLYTWAARGYNPMRIDGPLEWYRDPELMELRREQQKAAPEPKPQGPMVLDVSPEIAALLAGKA